MENKVLYKITNGGKIQQWRGWIENDVEVVVEYGQMDGKLTQSRYTAQPTNVGRSNERTAAQQAVFELSALYEAQVSNKHYRPTVEEAVARNNVLIPMKLQNYKDYNHKVKFPCWVQKKFNGSRRTYAGGKFLSKIGRVEVNKLKAIGEQLSHLGYDIDGEVYSHGMSLQRIRSASLKPNEDTPLIKLVIFDVPELGLTFEERIDILKEIKVQLDMWPELYPNLEVELPVLIQSKEELDKFFENTIADKYEGVVIRNQGSMYESGKRSYDTLKWKPRYDSEAYCYDVEMCKNGDGKLKLKASDSLDNVLFTAMMKVERRDGEKYPRDYDSMVKECLGKWVTFSYEELSDNGVPTKPISECLRDCDATGAPIN